MCRQHVRGRAEDLTVPRVELETCLYLLTLLYYLALSNECSLSSITPTTTHHHQPLITTTTRRLLSPPPHAHRRSFLILTRPRASKGPIPDHGQGIPTPSNPLPSSSCPKMPFYSAICYAIAMPSLKKATKKCIPPLSHPDISELQGRQKKAYVKSCYKKKNKKRSCEEVEKKREE